MGAAKEPQRYNVRSIAIIGAGPAGLAAAKYLLAEKAFNKIDILEQRSNVGGAWNFTPEIGQGLREVPLTHPHEPTEQPVWRLNSEGEAPVGSKTQKEAVFPSPMYEGLETNIPHFIMKFSDLSFPKNAQLFPKMSTVLKYLEDYSQDVRHLVRLQTQVLDVKLVTEGTDDGWQVTTRTFPSEEERQETYDAVVVASGHYNVPFVPAIKGLSKWNDRYPGTVTHSRFYRKPEPFRNKKVIIVGNSASGLDIGTQISKVAKQPVLISERSASYLSPGPDPAKVELPEIEEFLTEPHKRAVRFKNGRIEEDVDAVVFCTGYFYSYPFLSSLDPPVVSDGSRAEHLYQHIFYIPHPTLAFLALPQKVIPFPISECQSAVVGRVWSNRVSLPSQSQMTGWEYAEIASRGDSKGFHTLMFPLDADYINFLHDWSLKAERREGLENDGAGKIPPRWSERERWMREQFPAIKKAFLEKGSERENIKTIEDLGFEFQQAQKEVPTEGQQSVL